jgi:hypothetical protein
MREEKIWVMALMTPYLNSYNSLIKRMMAYFGKEASHVLQAIPRTVMI